jgi:hypothetical protein
MPLTARGRKRSPRTIGGQQAAKESKPALCSSVSEKLRLGRNPLVERQNKEDTMNGIPLFKKCGFTIDGTGYYARHLESYRLMYGKRSYVRHVLVALALLMVPAGMYFHALGVSGMGAVVAMFLLWRDKKNIVRAIASEPRAKEVK